MSFYKNKNCIVVLLLLVSGGQLFGAQELGPVSGKRKRGGGGELFDGQELMLGGQEWGLVTGERYSEDGDQASQPKKLCKPMKLYQCQWCSFKSCKQYYVEKHVNEEHPDPFQDQKKISCDMCNKSFACISNLNRHKRDAHYVEKQPKQQAEKQYQCSYCSLETTRLDNLKRHIQRMHPQKQSFEFSSDAPEFVPDTSTFSSDAPAFVPDDLLKFVQEDQ